MATIPNSLPAIYGIFNGRLGGTQLVNGVLTFVNGTETLSVSARSGLAKYQTEQHFWTRGHGPIPPTDQVEQDYELQLLPTYSAKIKGKFFHVLPDPIVCAVDGSLIRSEIGVHYDQGWPGTAGCVGVYDLLDFQAVIRFLLRVHAALQGPLMPFYVRYVV